MATLAIVMSGLPASGKTTLGRAIAEALDLPCLDKDDFLERLYETEGTGDRVHRRRLSRRSDKAFQDAAETLDTAVLISHWRPRGGPDDTGTPTAWLGKTFDTIVEVCCVCSPELAARRFVARQRHPGHLDAARGHDGTLARMRSLAPGYPLRIGHLVEVTADGKSDWPSMIEHIKARLASLDLR
ncbi:MAG: AAA family ATPase [Pseudomonadota bacterium]